MQRKQFLTTLCVLGAMLLPSACIAGAGELDTRMVLDPQDKISNSQSGGVAYNGEFYILFSSHSHEFKSYDGLNWQPVNAQNRIGGYMKKLIWDGHQFVAVTIDRLYVSLDGNSWTDKTPVYPDPAKQYTFQDMVYANGRYVILAQDKDKGDGFYIPGPNHLMTSSDLVHFEEGSKQQFSKIFSGDERPLESLDWNGSMFLALGNGSATSTDGQNWVGLGENSFGLSGYNSVWDGNKFWRAYGREIYSSANGLDWRTEYQFTAATYDETAKLYHNDGPTSGVTNIAFNGREYLAAGHRFDYMMLNNTIKTLTFFYSPNGVDWREVEIPGGDTDVNNILSTPTGFILLGNKVWYVSSQKINEPTDWAQQDIQSAKDHQLVPAKLLSFYQANATRREISEIAINLYEALTKQKAVSASGHPFSDTDNEGVLKAYQLGLVKGVDSDHFAPNEPVTRQDLSVILYRTLKASGVKIGSTTGWKHDFADVDDISGYAVEPLRVLNGAGIINGKEHNLVDPMGNTTREEAISIVERMYKQFCSVPRAPEKRN